MTWTWSLAVVLVVMICLPSMALEETRWSAVIPLAIGAGVLVALARWGEQRSASRPAGPIDAGREDV